MGKNEVRFAAEEFKALRNIRHEVEQKLVRQLIADCMRWSRLFGQFGGEVKLIPGFYHAASRSVSVAGACPGNGRFSFAR